ncbi:MAG: L,D-transpeptidase [Mogibacterium sp.]|nr:L,D-transpeptidase [Mogibacterium sp.]
MKTNTKRLLSRLLILLLAVMMINTGLGMNLNAYAENEGTTVEEPGEEPEEPELPAPVPVTNVTAVNSYGYVDIKWEASATEAGPNGEQIYYTVKRVSNKNKTATFDNITKLYLRDKYDGLANITYTYYVTANYTTEDGTVVSSEPVSVNKTTYGNPITPKRVQPVSELKAYAGYDCVKVTWKASTSKKGPRDEVIWYRVQRVNTATGKVVHTAKVKTNYYEDTNVNESYDRYYKYVVTAYYLSKLSNERVYSDTKSISKTVSGAKITPVKHMYITAKVSSNTSFYKSNKGFSYLGSIPGGTKLCVYDAGIYSEKTEDGDDTHVVTRYKITYGGKTGYLPTSRTTNRVAHYSSTNIYTDAEREYFINSYYNPSTKKVISSGTPYLIWVNPYTQKVTVFKSTTKNASGRYVKPWKIYNNFVWSCNTGRPDKITPCGLFEVPTNGRIYERHNVMFWTCFSLVSLHDKLSMSLGKPASEGCVRVDYANAKWMYYNIKDETRVFVY